MNTSFKAAFAAIFAATALSGAAFAGEPLATADQTAVLKAINASMNETFAKMSDMVVATAETHVADAFANVDNGGVMLAAAHSDPIVLASNDEQ
ncbi:MAG TPA: hypothetical protein VNH64_01100 [Parvularculaceae bacterium]|nr:hypothetical protein [Parvularculaceae bacterium]